jgi:hypothetical protein
MIDELRHSAVILVVFLAVADEDVVLVTGDDGRHRLLFICFKFLKPIRD